MKARDMVVFCPIDLRKENANPSKRNFRVADKYRQILRGNVKYNLIDAMRSAESSSATTAIISEETIVGSIDRILKTGQIYGEVLGRMSNIQPLFQGHNVTIIVTIRSYADFFTSLYAHRTRRHAMPEFATLKARFVKLQRRWTDVLTDITKAFPNSEILVMPFETAIVNGHGALCHLVGEPRLKEITEGLRADLPSPSAAAVKALNAKRGFRRGTKQQRLAVLDDFPRDKFAKFEPWTQPEKQHLNALYQEDLALIAAGSIPRVTLIDPSILPKLNQTPLVGATP